jgi:hypothetical protein
MSWAAGLSWLPLVLLLLLQEQYALAESLANSRESQVKELQVRGAGRDARWKA